MCLLGVKKMIRYDDNLAVDIIEIESRYIDGIYTTWYIDSDGNYWIGDENSKQIYPTTY